MADRFILLSTAVCVSGDLPEEQIAEATRMLEATWHQVVDTIGEMYPGADLRVHGEQVTEAQARKRLEALRRRPAATAATAN